MSARRTAAKRDSNEGEIINALRAAGCLVHPLSDEGLPDLLVYSPAIDRFILLEVKAKVGRLTDAQVAWWGVWECAGDKHIVRTVEEALHVVGR